MDANHTRPTGRLEAFSDGVFAIAITLLVLDIKVPHALPEGVRLTAALLGQWPAYVAFLSSFATIGIMWINHHRLFDHIVRADHTLFLLNLLLLLAISVVPFPTSLVAEYVLGPEGWVAAMIYAGMGLLIAVCFNLLWRYAASRPRLLDPEVDPRVVQGISQQYVFGPIVYLVAFALAWVNVTASLLLVLGLAVFFALPSWRATG